MTHSTLDRPPLAAADLRARLAHAIAPLSFAQERLWVLDQLEPGTATYNIPLPMRIDGPLDARALCRSVAAIVHRHAVLRTTLPAVNGKGVQRVMPPARVRLALVDLEAVAAEHRDALLDRLLAREAARPFDLARGPLFRVWLVRLAADAHVLSVTAHHTIFDGWSRAIFIREVAAVYHAVLQGRSPARVLPPLRLQYADFARWQRQQLTNAALQTQLAYWKAKLTPPAPPLDLPSEGPRAAERPGRGRGRGAEVLVRLPASLSHGVRALARRHEATVFMTLLASFAAVLRRYTGQPDLVIGTVTSGRGRPELDDLIGMFVNTLPLRIDASGAPNGLALLQRVRETCLEAFSRQDVPFEHLVREAAPDRDTGGSRLFNVLFAIQTIDARADRASSLRIREVGVRDDTAKFDLSVILTDAPDGISGVLRYATDRYAASTIERLAAHWQRLLAGFVAEPERSIAGLPLLDDAERTQIVTTWNATAVEYGPFVSLHELVQRQAARSPDAIAVALDAATLTYAELLARATALACELQARGVGPETRVGVYLARDPQLVVALLAILLAGGAYVPLDPSYPAARVQYMLHDSSAPLVLTTTTLAAAAGEDALPAARCLCLDVPIVDGEASGMMSPARTSAMHRDARMRSRFVDRRTRAAEAGAHAWAAGDDRVQHGAVDAAQPGELQVAVGADAAPASTSGPDAAERDSEPHVAPPSAARPFVSPRTWPGQAAYVIYTSGSTGRPKGVVNTHEAIVNRLRWMQATYALTPADRVLQKTPISFDVSVWELFWPLITGARLVMARPEGHRDSAYLAQLMADAGITIAHFVPSMLTAWLEEPALETQARTLRHIICSGEALIGAQQARVEARLQHVALSNLYGPTEAAIDVSAWHCERGAAPIGQGVPIGRPIANLRWHVADATGELVPAGMPGELYLAGVGLARGYHAQPARTAERFVPDPFGPPGSRRYRTGDRVQQRADGVVAYIGRIDGQIKLRGQRIELGEIEAALAALPGIRDAAVRVHRDQLIAYVATSDAANAATTNASGANAAVGRVTAVAADAALLADDDTTIANEPSANATTANAAGANTAATNARGANFAAGRITVAAADAAPTASAATAVANAPSASAATANAARVHAETANARGASVDSGHIAAATSDADAWRTALATRLPSYMIPARFVVLPELPRTVNGKLDRRALPDPPAPRTAASDREPRTDAERALARLWSELLRIESPGADANFFGLGGDSIISLQLVARARSAGWRITARQVFQHPTIAALAAAAEPIATASGTSDTTNTADTGPVAWGPMARWWWSEPGPAPHHFNQAIALRVTDPSITPARAGRAIDTLVSRHAALRWRVVMTPDGPTATLLASERARIWSEVDLTAIAAADRPHVHRRVAQQLQTSLSLTDGPVTRAAWMSWGADEPARLLWIAHHLAVDGVSWRVLLDELESICRALAARMPLPPPAPSASVHAWAAALAAYAARIPASVIDYWTTQAAIVTPPLPLDHAGAVAADPAGAQRQEIASLDSDETRALLERAPHAYGMQVDEVLLAALAETIADWCDGDDAAIRVELEGHGREEEILGLDLSRTVGWFTTLYPLVLRAPRPLRADTTMKAIKEQVRAVPDRGIGYGVLRYLAGQQAVVPAREPEIVFNYLGQFDQTVNAARAWGWAAEGAGRTVSPRAPRRHRLEISSAVSGGRLHVSWRFGAGHEPMQIAARLAAFMTRLRALIAHATAPNAGGYTPSDFPLAAVTQKELDTWDSAGRPIEEAYPLAPMQDGLLFHSLAAPESGVYVQQVRTRLTGALDVEALRAAWQTVVARHAILRTEFVWEGRAEPLQRVRRRVAVLFEVVDLRGDLRGDLDVDPDVDPDIDPDIDPDTVSRSMPMVAIPAAASAPAARGSSQMSSLKVAAWLAADRAKGFDLTRAPLLRVALLRVADDVGELVWTYHHLLLDGWSMAIVTQELFAAFEAARGGETPSWPATPRFGEYVAWARTQHASSAEAFWRQVLAGVTAPMPLPLAPDAAIGVTQERHHTADAFAMLDAATVARLGAAAVAWQVTLATVAQAAWALVLARLTGHDDVVFGTTVAGRGAPIAEIERMVGVLINTLPVRVRVPSTRSAGDWVQAVQTLLVAQRPFEASRLRDVQGWSDVSRGLPLITSVVVFENYPVPADSVGARGGVGHGAGAVQVGAVTVREQTNYALTLVIVPGATWQVRLSYASAIYDATTANRLVAITVRALTRVLAVAEQPVDAIDLLDDVERTQIVTTWNATAVEYGAFVGLHQLVQAQAARTPDAIAVMLDASTLTYAELLAQATALARELQTRGVGPETRVGVYLARDPQLVVALLAILLAGGAYVPLDPSYPAARVHHMLHDSGAPLVLTTSALAAAAAEDALPTTRCLCLDVPMGTSEAGDITSSARVADLHHDDLTPTRATAWRPVAAEADPHAQSAGNARVRHEAIDVACPGGPRNAADAEASPTLARPFITPRTWPGQAAYVIYTSGSTGRPKGVVNTHEAIVNRLRWMQATYALTPDDRVLQKTPISFDVSVWELFWPLITGARLVLARPEGHRDSAYLAQLMADAGITITHFVPSMLTAWLEEPALETQARTLRHIICSGEALTGAQQARVEARLGNVRHDGNVSHVTLSNLYGPTEAAIDVSAWFCERGEAPIGRGVPIGRPIANLRWHVGDAAGQLVPPGVPGELYLAGIGLARGYHAQPARTAERFVPDPFGPPGSRRYRTGDRVQQRADGVIEYLGRLDGQIKLRGQRIELGEIEAALAALPGVRDAAVRVHRDQLIAYVAASDATNAGTTNASGANAAVGRVAADAALIADADTAIANEPSANARTANTAATNARGANFAAGRIAVAAADAAPTASAATATANAPSANAATAHAAGVHAQTANARGANVDSGRIAAVTTDGDAWRMALATRLPSYMIPARFVVLSELPRTVNGKLDRRALPDPPAPIAAGAADRAPRTDAERALARIWSELLRIESPGADANFFALGGDSIISLQVVSRARAAGWRVTPRQVFQHATLAALAAVAEPIIAAAPDAVAEADDEAGTGDIAVAWSPIARWWRERAGPAPHHFNQAIALRVTAPWATARGVGRALDSLVARHSALRLRVPSAPALAPARASASDAHDLVITPVEPARIWSEVDFAAVQSADRAALHVRVAQALQRSLSLASGPIVRAAWCSWGDADSPRLIWVIHHLGVDGVSWRVLLEELEMASRAAAERQRPAWPDRTASVRAWSAALTRFATNGAQAAAAYWKRQAAIVVPPLPLDDAMASDVAGAQRQEVVTLEREETRLLLERASQAYGTHVEEVLLAALAETLAGWSGGDVVRVALEGHGREEEIVGLDVSRTVGWFTTWYPLVLQAPQPLRADTTLKAIKEQVRAVPDRGVSYGALRYLAAREDLAPEREPELLFNYLGQFDQSVGAERAWQWAAEGTGRGTSPATPRRQRIALSAAVSGGRLHLAWEHGPAHHAETIARLAARYATRLRALIAHAIAPDVGGYTLSDFPLAAVTQEELDTWDGMGRPIEDAYPLAPVQDGLLVHSLAAPGDGVYVEQVQGTLTGALDLAALRDAWNAVAARHAVLRTEFVWADRATPLQRVRRAVDVPVPVVEEDWRELDVATQEARWRDALAADRAEGFNLSRAPLLRVLVVRRADDVWTLRWTYHHAVLDGWSTARVLAEVMAAYRGDALEPAPPPYRAYVAWATAQAQDEGEAIATLDAARVRRGADRAAEVEGPRRHAGAVADADAPQLDGLASSQSRAARTATSPQRTAASFWRDALAGVTAPTPLPFAAPGAEIAAARVRETADVVAEVDAAAIAQLSAAAVAGQVTLATVAQAAWALVLARLTGQGDVLFGTTVAGRGAPIAGIERMVGVLINTLPVRVRVPSTQSVGDWVQAVQTLLVAQRPFEASRLRDVQGWSDVPRGLPLITSVVVFENYPMPADGSARGEAGEVPRGVQVGAVTVREQTNYALTLVIVPGATWQVRLSYAPAIYDATTAQRLLSITMRALTRVLAVAEQPVEAIDLLDAAERMQIITSWNATAAEYGAFEGLHQLVQTQAARTPDAIAVTLDAATLTYAELLTQATALACELQARGIGPETRVGVYLARDPQLVVALLAILLAGGAYVPLDPSYPAARVQHMLHDSGAALVLTTTAFAAAAGEDALSRARCLCLDAPIADGEASGMMSPARTSAMHRDARMRSRFGERRTRAAAAGAHVWAAGDDRVQHGAVDAAQPSDLQAAVGADTAASTSGLDASIAEGEASAMTPSARAGRPFVAPRTWPGQAAYVIYTSGSTGRPKGVVNTHEAIVNRLRWMQATYALTPDDRVLQKTPISFDVSVWELFWPLITGARMVLARPEGHRDSAYLAQLMADAGITVTHFVPSMLTAWLEEPALETQARTLRHIICSGEALIGAQQARVEARLGNVGHDGNGSHVTLSNLYGPTEAAIDVSAWICERGEAPIGRGVPIGRPIANLRWHVADAAGQLVPPGVPGELYLAGIGLARGYHAQPARTAERFVPDPFGPPGSRRYRTGDRVQQRADGVVEYLGRLDGQIKLRGQRIELGEIEAALAALPGVRDAAVRVHRDQLVAYVAAASDARLPAPATANVPSKNAAATNASVASADRRRITAVTSDLDAWRAILAARLPSYMIPARFILLDELPRTVNGKLDRRALPDPEREGSSADTSRALLAPRTWEEYQLAAIWQELLGLPTVDVRDRFFDAGGHSILALQLVSRIQARCGVAIPLAVILETPALEALAARIRRERLAAATADGQTREPVLLALQPEGDGPPFFCVHPAGGHVFCYIELARALPRDRPFYGIQFAAHLASEQESVERLARAYVDEIQHARPHGPYVLGGWSSGGIVAYEIAQQLRARGEAVELLVLFDSGVPDPAALDADIERQVLAGLSEELGLPFEQDDDGRDEEMRFGELLARAREAGRVPPDVDLAQGRRLLATFAANSRAAQRYRPSRYDGRLLVFAADARNQAVAAAASGTSDRSGMTSNDMGSLDALPRTADALGWRPFCDSDSDVEIITMPATHHTILRPPQVTAIADAIAARLRVQPAQISTPASAAKSTPTSTPTSTPIPAAAPAPAPAADAGGRDADANV